MNKEHVVHIYNKILLNHKKKCCLLTCIQISQEAEQVVWYSHLFKNFPYVGVIHTVKGFSIVNEAVDIFLEFSLFWKFSMIQSAAAKLLQLCPNLCDPIDGSPPGSSVPGILQARILEWIAILLQGIFPTEGLNPGLRHLLHCRPILYPLSHLGSPN